MAAKCRYLGSDLSQYCLLSETIFGLPLGKTCAWGNPLTPLCVVTRTLARRLRLKGDDALLYAASTRTSRPRA